MLFDLQSGKRRRVVQITFGTLAAIFAISFVFLGVGTGGGGLSFSDLFGSGGDADPTSAFDDDIEAQQAKLQVNPNDTVALAELVSLHYQAGRTGVDENGALTSDGQEDLQQSVDAWNKYVKATDKPDQGTATFAVLSYDALAAQAFFDARSSTTNSEALTNVNNAVDDWKQAAAAQQILVDANPISSNYVKLAYYQYLAGLTTEGDASAEQAKKAKDAQDPSAIDQQLKSVKTLGTQLQSAIKQLTKETQSTGGAATGGGSNPLGGLGGGSFGGTGGLGGG